MRSVRAELLKLATLPSLRRTALLTMTATGLLRWAVGSDGPLPLTYTQAGFLIAGVLAVGSEFEAGAQIRATLLALPRRLPLLAAKAVALGLMTLPAAVSAALLCGAGMRVTGYLMATTLLAGAVTAVVRHPVTSLLPLLLVYYVATPLLRKDWLPGDPAGAGTTAAVWALAAAVVAAVVFPRRDAA
ncbi:hypothetical protein [Catenuloplanes japonicus]|uniref:hypothetical protein n=1 Tax=Catenuloplanes japonicus TaxID=33876 RepID=UPI00052708F4|nr:hypothetical protein [Catenuloplanes japonicus]